MGRNKKKTVEELREYNRLYMREYRKLDKNKKFQKEYQKEYYENVRKRNYVYKLYGENELLYIGSSIDKYRAVMHTYASNCTNLIIDSSKIKRIQVCYLDDYTKKERLFLEKLLIEKYSPPANLWKMENVGLDDKEREEELRFMELLFEELELKN